MKIREALAALRSDMCLKGEVEIDGLYALGHVRPKNRKEDRVDRRLPQNQSPDRVVVMAIRERRKGGQSVTRITRGENPECAWDMMRTHVEEHSSVFADEHPAYNAFEGHYDVTRVNHQVAYQHGEGISTNQIESFFSRVRRAYRGIHHRFSVKYLHWYVAELSWREDRRRLGNRGQTLEMLGRALAHPVSRNLCGYWQGNKPPDLVWEPGGKP